MVKVGPSDGPCGWEEQAEHHDVEDLHQVLNCASARGCNQCVRCSETALELMLRRAREAGRRVVAGLDRLEAEMELIGAIGM